MVKWLANSIILVVTVGWLFSFGRELLTGETAPDGLHSLMVLVVGAAIGYQTNVHGDKKKDDTGKPVV